MKLKLLITVTTLWFATDAFSQVTRKVLFIGNSYLYTNDLPLMIENVAASAGDQLIQDSNTIGGYTLSEHATNTVTQTKITAQDWDYIVLQEQSQLPSFPVPSAFMQGLSSMTDYIRTNSPCAQTLTFATWGYENGDVTNCPNNAVVCTYQGMQDLITSRYLEMSELYKAEMTPVGSVWSYIKNNFPQIDLYSPDGSHPSAYGTYLAACCFYTSIFRKDPQLISFTAGLNTEYTQIIKNAVNDIVYNHMEDWFIGIYTPAASFSFKIGSNNNEIVTNQNNSIYYTTVEWDFGDGTQSNSLLPSHQYESNGTYAIRLTASKCIFGETVQAYQEKIVTFCEHTPQISPDLYLCPGESGVVSTEEADSYHWLDLYGNPIPGATNQSFTAYAGEAYSVVTTVGDCSERSVQYFVDGPFSIEDCEGLGNIDFDESAYMSIFPVPVKDNLTIQCNDKIETVSVYNINMELVNVFTNINTIDFSGYPSGMYILTVTTESHSIHRKIIK
ncbi:T9SS type A sorting domain-containing protein [Flavobacterium sp. LaA7.5]|nr:T9SS type A sorting domain-containing protein [Flavobacterium salilacus subsp. altitudinum]